MCVGGPLQKGEEVVKVEVDLQEGRPKGHYQAGGGGVCGTIRRRGNWRRWKEGGTTNRLSHPVYIG